MLENGGRDWSDSQIVQAIDTMTLAHTNPPGTSSMSDNLWPNLLAHCTHSSMVTFCTGMKGHTSIAPIRGCSPVQKRHFCKINECDVWWYYSISATASTAVPECLVMSMSLNATRAAFSAPSIAASGGPTKVYTVLFVEDPGSTSSKLQPSVAEMASAMASMTWILYILAKILSCNANVLYGLTKKNWFGKCKKQQKTTTTTFKHYSFCVGY